MFVVWFLVTLGSAGNSFWRFLNGSLPLPEWMAGFRKPEERESVRKSLESMLDFSVKLMQPETKVIDVLCHVFNTTESEVRKAMKSWDTSLAPEDPLVKVEDRARVMRFAKDVLDNFEMVKPLLEHLEIDVEYVRHMFDVLRDVNGLTVGDFLKELQFNITNIVPLKEAIFAPVHREGFTIEQMYQAFGFGRLSAMKDYAKVLKTWKAGGYIFSPESISKITSFGAQYNYYTTKVAVDTICDVLRPIFAVVDVALSYEQTVVDEKISHIQEFLRDLPTYEALWKSCVENMRATDQLRKSAIQHLEDLRNGHMQIKSALKEFFGVELKTSFSSLVWLTDADRSMFGLLKTWFPFFASELGFFRDFTGSLGDMNNNIRQVVSVLSEYFNTTWTVTYDKLIRSIPDFANPNVPIWQAALFHGTNASEQLTGLQQSFRDMVLEETSFFEVIGTKDSGLDEVQRKIRRLHEILSIQGSFCDGLERIGITIKRSIMAVGELLKSVSSFSNDELCNWKIIEPHKDAIDKTMRNIGALGQLLATGQFTLEQLSNAVWHESSILVQILSNTTKVLMEGSPTMSDVIATIPACFWDVKATINTYKEIRVFSLVNIGEAIKLDETNPCGLSFTILTIFPFLLVKHLSQRLAPTVTATNIVTLKDFEAASGRQLSISLVPIMHSLHLLSSDTLSPGIALEYVLDLPINASFTSTNALLKEVNDNKLSIDTVQLFSDSVVNLARAVKRRIQPTITKTPEITKSSPLLPFLAGFFMAAVVIAVLVIMFYVVNRHTAQYDPDVLSVDDGDTGQLMVDTDQYF